MVVPSNAGLSTTLFAPSVVLGTVITPGTAALSLTPYAPSVIEGQIVTPGTLSLTITLYPPTVTVAAPYFGVLKWWNGSSWIQKPVKVYTGSWATKALKMWTGTVWGDIDTTP